MNKRQEAKRSLKIHIDFMKSLLKRLNGSDKQLRDSSILAAWCIDQYFNFKFMADFAGCVESTEGSKND